MKTRKELQELWVKNHVSIGDSVQFGDGVSIGDDTIIEDRVRIEDYVSIGHDVRILSDVEIGYDSKIEYNTIIADRANIGYDSIIRDNVIIGEDANIGVGVTIGSDAIIENGASIKDHFNIPIRTKIPANHHIERILTIYNAYKYHASIWEHEGELFIALDDYTRTESEWSADFWNDDNEFPKGSEQGDRRLDAYNSIVKLGYQLFKGK